MNEGVWSPLSDTDPVPGDPWKVYELSAHFAEQAERIRDLVSALKKIEADEIKSAFVEAMIDRRDEVIPNLDLLADRYDNSVNALRPYSYALEAAQEDAGKSKTDAWAAHRRLVAAQKALEAAAAQPPIIPAGPGPIIPQPVAPFIGPVVPDPEEELRRARADLDAAQSLLDDAVERRDRAAARAIDLLDEANHDDLKNPNRGFFSPLGDMVDGVVNLPKNLATIAAAAAVAPAAIFADPLGAAAGLADWAVNSFSSLELLSGSLGLIGGALGVAGLLFPPFGVSMALVGAGISATKLGIDTYLAATGRGSWGDVALGAIGLATFGAVRIAAQAQRTAVLRDASKEFGQLKLLADSLPDGLDVATQARMEMLEGVTKLYKGDAVANGILPRMSSWGNAILTNPSAPMKAVLDLSPSAQKIAHVSTGLRYWGDFDTVTGVAGTTAGYADEVKPMVKEWVP